jgi:hypothetical protein
MTKGEVHQAKTQIRILPTYYIIMVHLDSSDSWLDVQYYNPESYKERQDKKPKIIIL